MILLYNILNFVKKGNIVRKYNNEKIQIYYIMRTMIKNVEFDKNYKRNVTGTLLSFSFLVISVETQKFIKFHSLIAS